MKKVNARAANQGFSTLLSEVEAGEEVLITKHGRPVAILRPYSAPKMIAARRKAIERAIRLMAKGLPWGSALRRFTREEMHER